MITVLGSYHLWKVSHYEMKILSTGSHQLKEKEKGKQRITSTKKAIDSKKLDQYSAISWKWCKTGCKLVLFTDRKSYMGF